LNIALFGGTFDPIHNGHLKAAVAAARKFRLDRVLFVPTGNPPHKVFGDLTHFDHRFAMVALACTRHAHFVPSLLEAPDSEGRAHYSINTVRRALQIFPEDHLFFLIGADAFLDLPHWKEYGKLMDLVDFIVVSRPGFASEQIRKIVPKDLIRHETGPSTRGEIRLRRTTIRILHDVKVPAASTDIRRAIREGRKLAGRVPAVVEEYILKEGLYCPREAGRKGE
jgi:nicotinate-nucleotide adenylyltransferase